MELLGSTQGRSFVAAFVSHGTAADLGPELEVLEKIVVEAREGADEPRLVEEIVEHLAENAAR